MPGESLNILMYDIATYTHANVEKTANSQVRLDACSDYSLCTIMRITIRCSDMHVHNLCTGALFINVLDSWVDAEVASLGTCPPCHLDLYQQVARVKPSSGGLPPRDMHTPCTCPLYYYCYYLQMV